MCIFTRRASFSQQLLLPKHVIRLGDCEQRPLEALTAHGAEGRAELVNVLETLLTHLGVDQGEILQLERVDKLITPTTTNNNGCWS